MKRGAAQEIIRVVPVQVLLKLLNSGLSTFTQLRVEYLYQKIIRVVPVQVHSGVE
jgi:hypothetical protein